MHLRQGGMRQPRKTSALGLKDATTDQAEIRQWWAPWPCANVAIRTGSESGVFVVDIDTKNDGRQTLLQLIDEHGEWPATVEEVIGGGGAHIFFRHPGHKITSRDNVRPGLDVKGDGGYVVCAPSRHISGGTYRWDECRGPDEIELADAPQWLLELVSQPTNNMNGDHRAPPQDDISLLVSRASAYALNSSPASYGQRNRSAFSLAGHLASFEVEGAGTKLDESHILNLMRPWNDRCDPPLPDTELQRAVQSAMNNGTPREPHLVETKTYDNNGTTDRTPQQDDKPLSIASAEGRTDIANGRRFARMFANKARYCYAWKKWLVWDGKRWNSDDGDTTKLYGKIISDRLWREVRATDNKEAFRFAVSSAASYRVKAMLDMAASEPGIPIQPDKLDRDPWLLNVSNGTIDLLTGELKPHDASDFITKIAPVTYDSSADCATWLAFLERTMAGRTDLIAYLRQLVGLCLTGSTREHVLPFLHGSGANGKSTFVNALLSLMGTDYAIKANSDLLLVKRNDAHPTERADLHGKRLVACVEAEDGRRLAESLVKDLTGGDRIRARRMHEDFWEFGPTHKIWLAANHKPVVRGTDHGIWRRIKLIPFTVTIPDDEQDAKLPDKLMAELPGILNWAMLGCLEWQQDGLDEPQAVISATGGYRAEMDVVGAFVDERCVLGDQHEAGATELYKAYQQWCEDTGEKAIGDRRFGERLSERGVGRRKGTKGKRLRCGIALRSD